MRKKRRECREGEERKEKTIFETHDKSPFIVLKHS